MRDERGAVALIATIITAVLISIVTSGLSRGFSTELRQSVDSNNSIRAYYAAEAGVEDALQRLVDSSNCPLSADLKSRIDCDPTSLYYYTETDGVADRTSQPVNSPVFQQLKPAPYRVSDVVTSDPGAKWIHRYVKLSSQASEGALAKDKSVQVDMPASGINRLEIEWNNPEKLDSRKAGGWISAPPFPSSWGTVASPEPAALQLTLISWGENGGEVTNFDPVRKYLGLACQSDGSCAAPGIGEVRFSVDNPYRLRWTITGLDSAKNYVVRLTSKFSGTHYRLSAFHPGNGTPVEIQDRFILIDVTGKSGNTYRRLVVKKQYQADVFSIFDFVLASELDMCKSFSVYSDQLDPPASPNGC